MSWIKRLKQVAGWDLFLEILAVGVLIALGAFTLMTESCQGEATRAPASNGLTPKPVPRVRRGGRARGLRSARAPSSTSPPLAPASARNQYPRATSAPGCRLPAHVQLWRLWLRGGVRPR